MLLGVCIIIGLICVILYYGWELILLGICLWLLWLLANWTFSLINWSEVGLFLHITFWVIIFVAVCGLMWRGLLCED